MALGGARTPQNLASEGGYVLSGAVENRTYHI